jgi:hypothetical protein
LALPVAELTLFVEQLPQLSPDELRERFIGNKLERSRFCQYPFVQKYD